MLPAWFYPYLYQIFIVYVHSVPIPERPGVLKGGPDSKRFKLSDSEDSDEDDGLAIEGVPVVKVDVKPAVDGAEAAEKAAQARATIPLEKRQQDFKEMLLERGVSMTRWQHMSPVPHIRPI